MFYILGYTEALCWLAFPLFLAVWCALAGAGRPTYCSRAPARVPVRQSVRRYDI
jgi:hypothetical protein